MSIISISEEQFQALKDKVVLVTGGSSGIGLATIQLLISVGAKVINVDRAEQHVPEERDPAIYQFVKADVTSWNDLRAAFEHAISAFGAIDHVFANAGIPNKTDLQENDLDAEGLLAPPDLTCLQVNLVGLMYTVKLAAYYIRRQSPTGSPAKSGSIVLTASASSFQTFSGGDYVVAKHGVLGVMRSLYNSFQQAGQPGQALPLRINCIAPSWTDTGVVPGAILKMAGVSFQSTEVVAKSVLSLMADDTKHGHLLYSRCGQYLELGQTLLDHTYEKLALVLGPGAKPGQEEEEMLKVTKIAAQLRAQASSKATA